MESIVKLILVFCGLIAIVVLLPNILVLSSTGVFNASQPAMDNLGTVNAAAAQTGPTGLVAISFDGGATFNEAQIADGVAQNILTIKSRGGEGGRASERVFYAGTDHGLLMSKDNGLTWHTWTDLEKNIDANTAIYDIEFDPYTDAIFVAAVKNGFGIVWRSEDNFMTIQSIWSEPKMPAYALALHDGYVLIGLADGRVLNYDPDLNTFAKLISFNSAVRRLKGTFTNDVVAMLENGDIYRSTSPAEAWTKIQSTGGVTQSFLPFFGPSVPKSFGIAIDTLSPSAYYLARSNGLFRSDDRGDTWNLVNSILPNGAVIDSVAAHGGNLYVTSGSKLYESSDGDVSWKIKEPLATKKRLAPIYITGSGSIVVVGTRL